jgi:hypothetical protein
MAVPPHFIFRHSRMLRRAIFSQYERDCLAS